MNTPVIKIFTDGSCNPTYAIGGWAAILLVGERKVQLFGEASDTTHQRMELMAVIKAIEAADEQFAQVPLEIYTDSQYVARICERMDKLTRNEFITKSGKMLPNTDLIKLLIAQIKTHSIKFVKVKAHQRLGTDVSDAANGFEIKYNVEVDKLARKVVRERLTSFIYRANM